MKRLLFSLVMGMSLHGASDAISRLCSDETSKLVALSSLAHRPESLFHDGNDFMVQHLGKMHKVARHEVHKDIRSKDLAALINMQRQGYFDVRPSVDGERYSIEFQPRLNGGGPIAGRAAYYVVKAIIYGCTLGLASVVFKKKNSPLHNITVDGVIVKAGEALTIGTGYVGAVVANHSGVRRRVQDAAPIVIMTLVSTPSVTTPIWIESVALGAQALFTGFPFLP